MLLVAVIAAATLWLGATGQLGLYIHPRYDVFTIALGAIGLVGCAAAVGLAVRRAVAARRTIVPEGDHEHDDDAPRSVPGRAVAAVSLVVCAGLAAAMLLLPPTTLSSATALQRDLSADAAADSAAATAALAAAQGANAETFAGFDVRDWALLLRQTQDPAFYAGKPVDVVGFVTPHPELSDVFYVSRFSITCCAVDAQPFGVPVLLDGWDAEVSADDWVRVSGDFVAAEGELPIVLEPAEVTATDEPAEPYLF